MMGALIRALTNNAVENIEEALGMTDLQYSVAGSWTGCGRLCHRPAERADRGGAGHKLE